MIIRARVVVTMDGAAIDNAAVVIAGGRISDVGTFPEISARCAGEEIVDLGEQAVLPGLINAHCHLDYSCLRGKIPRQESFANWIRAINAEKAMLSEDDYLTSIADGFAEAKRFGTTTIANLTDFPQLVAKIQPPIRTWWFAELIDVREPERVNEVVDLAVESLKSTQHWGLAPHALYTASGALYRRCEEMSQREDILLTTHLAESREEMSMFCDASGALFELTKEIGRPMNDCFDATPLELFLGTLNASPGRTGRALPNWIFAHLNELTENDFELLKNSTTKFHVVHSPRSHGYFAHSPFAFERLRKLGFNICLGTDSLASNDDLSLFAEMRALQNEFRGVSPEEILRMATVNPALALRQQKALGKISRGARADLLAVPFSGGDAFEVIVAFRGEPWMMLGGKSP